MPMTTRDTIDMMRRCSEEIKSLRRQLAEAQPKAQAYETICSILGLLPRPSVVCGEDLAWRLDKEAEKLLKELVAGQSTEE